MRAIHALPRRALAALVLSAALLVAAGCTGSGKSGSNGSASGSSGSPSATTSGGANPGSGAPGGGAPGGGTGTGTPSAGDRKVCDDTETLIADSTQKFGEEVVKVLDSGSVGEGQQKALAAIKTLFAEWSTGLRAQSGKASDPNLKKALSDYADGLEKVKNQINNINDLANLQDLNTPEIEAATDKIAEICG
jgi:hypothetical protein